MFRLPIALSWCDRAVPAVRGERTLGCMKNSNDWDELTARYESFVEIDHATGVLRSSWHKFDSSGRLVDGREHW